MTRPHPTLTAEGEGVATLDPDARLALQARNGSSAAFEILVKRHQAGVRAFLRRIASDRTADDLAQDAFLQAWSKLGQWRGEGSFKGWLFAIAVRVAQGARRGEARAMTRDAAWHTESAQDPGADEALGVEARIDLDRALAALPESQRAVLSLCLGAGLSHGEAAQALGMPLGTVKSHAMRGREAVLAHFRNLQAPTGTERIAR